MYRLFCELQKLSKDKWVVGEPGVALQNMISLARDLQNIPATREVLNKPSIRALYAPICGSLRPFKHGVEQNRTHVSIAACYALQKQICQFLQTREEIKEADNELYTSLWELKRRPHDAVLNSLADMPRSLHEFI